MNRKTVFSAVAKKSSYRHHELNFSMVCLFFSNSVSVQSYRRSSRSIKCLASLLKSSENLNTLLLSAQKLQGDS